jgi:hypothetical protein
LTEEYDIQDLLHVLRANDVCPRGCTGTSWLLRLVVRDELAPCTIYALEDTPVIMARCPPLDEIEPLYGFRYFSIILRLLLEAGFDVPPGFLEAMLEQAPDQGEFFLRLTHLKSAGAALEAPNEKGRLLCRILRFIAGGGGLKTGWDADVVVERVIAAGISVNKKALKLAVDGNLYGSAMEIAKILKGNEARE